VTGRLEYREKTMPRKPAEPKLIRLPRKTAEGSLEEAYELLGVNAADVMAAPKVSDLLELCGILGKVWDYLEASDTASAKKLVSMRARISMKSHMNVLPFEAFCVAAEVDTRIALGILADVIKAHVSILRNASALEKFEKAKGKAEAANPNAGSELAVLPPIEKDVKRLSDRFNQRFLNQAPNADLDVPVVEEDEEGDDGEV